MQQTLEREMQHEKETLCSALGSSIRVLACNNHWLVHWKLLNEVSCSNKRY